MIRNSLLLHMTIFLGACAVPCGAATLPFDAANNIISFRIDGTARSNGFAIDTLGLFGTAGADLSGQAMSISMSWDATYMAANCVVNGVNTTCDATASAAEYIRQSVTIGGVTVIPTTAASTATTLTVCYTCARNLGTIIFNGPLSNAQFQAGAVGFIDPNSVTQVASPQFSQAAILDLVNHANGFLVGLGSRSNGETIQLSSATITDTTAPEPSSWMLFGLGLGAVGVVRRRIC